MMDELQNEPFEIVDDDDTGSATVEEVLEDEPQEEAEQSAEGEETEKASVEDEPVVFDERQQAKVNEIVGQKVAKIHQAKTEAEELKARLADLEAKLPQEQLPDIPPVPNPDNFYGDPEGFRKANEERDAVILKRAGMEHQQRLMNEQKQALENQRLAAEARKQQEVLGNYLERAKGHGIEPDTVVKQTQIVSQLLPDAGLQDHIASDEKGPLIVNFLANNLMEAEKLGSMNPLTAALYVENQIKPRLASAKTQTNAPKPASIVDGASAPKGKDPALEGGTWG